MFVLSVSLRLVVSVGLFQDVGSFLVGWWLAGLLGARFVTSSSLGLVSPVSFVGLILVCGSVLGSRVVFFLIFEGVWVGLRDLFLLPFAIRCLFGRAGLGGLSLLFQ
ncbi:hypothetical protein [Ahrensia kielensis]|uniref:hypothetical protein n=1 Tax=Ahrensia kielensis TaxID=76980 RepID=UPI0012E9A40D|nr:hypothetical protein [Ahrensia kielensis]